ncbi:CD1375 family protein [Schleiferilactobacillus harbinensis]|jgi:hypothetical protein|nr:CD1375 family protein [Schleiferilactobacillus harbinensis]
MNAIKQLYAKAITDGQRTIDSVPEIIREDVKKIVDAAVAEK